MSVNIVIAGRVSEIGGGKFANGAITGAYKMLFNDLMHRGTKITTVYTYKRMGQVPLDENVGMQMATYITEVTVSKCYYDNGLLFVEASATSFNTYIEGKVSAWVKITIATNDQAIESKYLTLHHSEYFTQKGYYPVGETIFQGISYNSYTDLTIRIEAGWNVEISPNQHSVPTFPATLGFAKINVNETYKIK